MLRYIHSVLIIFSVQAVSSGASQAMERQKVHFGTRDGGLIYGFLYPAGKHGVVLAHGAIFSKESWEEFATELAQKGLTALALDFRGYGKSKAGSNPDGLYEDILAAMHYLRQYGSTSISVIGASMGAAAAAKASIASKPGEIEKLILLSPVAIRQPERLQGRLLIIASKKESMAGIMRETFGQAPDPKKIIFLEGNAHAQHIFKTDQADKLKAEILKFLGN